MSLMCIRAKSKGVKQAITDIRGQSY